MHYCHGNIEGYTTFILCWLCIRYSRFRFKIGGDELSVGVITKLPNMFIMCLALGSLTILMLSNS